MKTIIFLSLLISMLLAAPACTVIDLEATASKLPPEIKSFSSDMPAIEKGKFAVLTWDVTNADTVTLEPAAGNVIASGSQLVNPVQSTAYILLATNKFGSSRQSLTLTVIEPTSAQPPAIISFKARPERVSAGVVVELLWEVTDAEAISIESDSGQSSTLNDKTGSIIVQPVITTIYTLKARNGSGISSLEALVTIRPDAGYYFGKCN
ncbi:MAG: hypothetical protein A2Z02_06290 [Chloroflexi bacterium RBG_16_48_7]|nr:MAG: hypothetical protein A2Z02_06290 [Chloroflexi bacterium RBG_16_48_7]